MKLLHNLVLLILTAFIFSCKKDLGETVKYLGGTNPVLNAKSNTGTNIIELKPVDSLLPALELSWTNPNYQFTTGPNSQDVGYSVQIDTVGAKFTNPNLQPKGPNELGGLSLSLTEGEINNYLANQLQLKTGVSHDIEIRVISTLAGSNVPLVSNVIQLKATPYVAPPKIPVPASGKLYITGSATPASWMNGGDAEVLSQKFTQVSPTLFEIPSIALNGGGSYLFVPVYGDWSDKYGGTGGTNNTNNVNGDNFKKGGSDLLAPAASGNYKIQVDFQRGVFTVTKL
jgi:starch-binding outer membrane protein SusE/F